MYYIDMAQPTDPPLSVRMPRELLSEVEAWAKSVDMSRNAAIVELIGYGLEPSRIKLVPPAPTTWPSGALVEPHHTEDPAPKLTLGSAVTFGRPEAKAGSRLKKR